LLTPATAERACYPGSLSGAGFLVRWSGTGDEGVGPLLPAGLAVCEAFGPVAPDPLLPGEGVFVETAVESRRLEFARGRSCARRALARLGAVTSPILSREDRAPIWPAGVVGSISHCRDYRCAVVGQADRWAAVGVDAEPLQRLDSDLHSQILVAAERRMLERLPDTIPWACVVFSIKEAIYKVWHPLMRRWLGFHDACVEVDPAKSRFQAELTGIDIPSSLRRLEGPFAIDGRLIISALALPTA